jgi:hypothetical protein
MIHSWTMLNSNDIAISLFFRFVVPISNENRSLPFSNFMIGKIIKILISIKSAALIRCQRVKKQTSCWWKLNKLLIDHIIAQSANSKEKRRKEEMRLELDGAKRLEKHLHGIYGNVTEAWYSTFVHVGWKWNIVLPEPEQQLVIMHAFYRWCKANTIFLLHQTLSLLRKLHVS